LIQSDTPPSVSEAVQAIQPFAQFPPTKTNYIQKIYRAFAKRMPIYLEEDLSGGLKILDWLSRIAETIGDNQSITKFYEMVRKLLFDQIFETGDFERATELWDILSSNNMAKKLAAELNDQKIMTKYMIQINRFDEQQSIDFVCFEIMVASFCSVPDLEQVVKLLKFGLGKAYNSQSRLGSDKIVQTLRRFFPKPSNDFLFDIAVKDPSPFGRFVFDYYLDVNSSIIESNISALAFIESVEIQKSPFLIAEVIKRRAKNIESLKDIEELVQITFKTELILHSDKVGIFGLLDKKLPLLDRKSTRVADTIYNQLIVLRDKNQFTDIKCPRSTFVRLLQVLDDKRMRSNLNIELQKLYQLGFPPEASENEVNILIERLFRTRPDPKELCLIVQVFEKGPTEYSNQLVRKILEETNRKKTEYFNALLNILANPKFSGGKISVALMNNFVKRKHPDKEMIKFYEYVEHEAAKKYFLQFSAQVRARVIQAKSKSGLLGLFKSERSDAE
jgi:hypothetical protein